MFSVMRKLRVLIGDYLWREEREEDGSRNGIEEFSMTTGEFSGLVDYLEADGCGKDGGERVYFSEGGAQGAFFGGVGGDHDRDGF